MLPSTTTDQPLKGGPHPNQGGQTWGKVEVPESGEPIRNVATCVNLYNTLGLKTLKAIKLWGEVKRRSHKGGIP